MIVDALLMVSGSITGNTVTPQTVTGASAVLSTNTVDLGTNRDIGEGNDLLKALVEITTAFAGLTTLTIEVIQADAANLTGNVTVIGSAGAVPVASLTAGTRLDIELNPRIASLGQRYLGIRYTPTGTGTAGALVAHFGSEVQDGQKFYPSGYAVL